MQFFPKQLKALREARHFTQTQAAEMLGMKQQTYQKIESGKASDIKLSTLTNICKTFGVSADWLIGLSVPDGDT